MARVASSPLRKAEIRFVPAHVQRAYSGTLNMGRGRVRLVDTRVIVRNI